MNTTDNVYVTTGKPMGAVSVITTGNYHCQPAIQQVWRLDETTVNALGNE